MIIQDLCGSIIWNSNQISFSIFTHFMENQFLIKIKKFQSDRETKFTVYKFQDHLIQSGIHHRMSCPYTPS